jgi:hypothetical protein
VCVRGEADVQAVSQRADGSVAGQHMVRGGLVQQAAL